MSRVTITISRTSLRWLLEITAISIESEINNPDGLRGRRLLELAEREGTIDAFTKQDWQDLGAGRRACSLNPETRADITQRGLAVYRELLNAPAKAPKAMEVAA